jgi:hypothetical protein
MHKLALILAALIVGPAAGWLSARVMLERAAVPAEAAASGWQEVRHQSESVKATYETSFYLDRGQLPPPQHVRQFVRTRDEDGNSLRADCATRVEGRPPSARWWQINAESKRETRVLTSGAIVREPSGLYAVTISNLVSPGNWLEVGNTDDYVMRIIVHDAAGEEDAAVELPTVRRLGC